MDNLNTAISRAKELSRNGLTHGLAIHQAAQEFGLETGALSQEMNVRSALVRASKKRKAENKRNKGKSWIFNKPHFTDEEVRRDCERAHRD